MDMFLYFSLVPGSFGNQQTQHLHMIKGMLQTSMNDSANFNVQVCFCNTYFCIYYKKITYVCKN